MLLTMLDFGGLARREEIFVSTTMSAKALNGLSMSWRCFSASTHSYSKEYTTVPWENVSNDRRNRDHGPRIKREPCTIDADCNTQEMNWRTGFAVTVGNSSIHVLRSG